MIAEQTKAGARRRPARCAAISASRELQRRLAQLPTTILSSAGDGPHTLAEIGVRTNRDGTLGVDPARLQAVLAADPDGVEALFNPGQYSSSPFLDDQEPRRQGRAGHLYDHRRRPGRGGRRCLGQGQRRRDDRRRRQSRRAARLGRARPDPRRQRRRGQRDDHDRPRPRRRAPGDPRRAARPRAAPSRRAGAAGREATRIAEDRDALETRSDKYYNQLLTSFTAMDRQVSAFKATQSYLDQQIKMWTNDKD